MRTTTTARIVAALGAFVLVVAACGGSDGTDPSAAGGKEKRKQGRDRNQDSKKKGDRSNDPATVPGEGGGANAGGGGANVPAPENADAAAAPAGGFQMQPSDSRIDPSLARRSATEREPEPDARKEGVTPGYAEMLETNIQGLGENVRITFTFAGNIPAKMPNDKTFMVVGFATTGRSRNEAFAVGANASETGWSPYAGGKGERQKFPGTFAIQDDRMVMEIPWSFLEGPRTFSWYSNSSWFTQVANTTHYAFDPIPNERAGRFPN